MMNVHAVVQREFSSVQQAASQLWFPKSIGVIGAGQMGAGIALSFGMSVVNMSGGNNTLKKRITVLDIASPDILEARRCTIMRDLDKWIPHNFPSGQERSTDSWAKLLDRQIKWVSMAPDAAPTWKDVLSSADFVIEAIPEKMELKTRLFEIFEALDVRPKIIATNTSSLSVTALQSCLSTIASSRVVGMHFMNPATKMHLVEISAGLLTDPEVVVQAIQLAEALGKQTTQSTDSPGFISNRILMPYINEAMFALQEGVGTKEDIDLTMKLGSNVPMGPLKLADFIGLDICLDVLNVLQQGISYSRFQPCPLLVQHVRAGWLGRKTKRGFYNYN